MLLDHWHKMWNEVARYGPAGLKIRRGLIGLFALIMVVFVIDAMHMTDHQLNELIAAGAVTATVVAAATARK
jgi:hypothetical protein